MFRKQGFMLSLSALMMTGCASIMNPGPDKVTFTSLPAGATLTIDGAPKGKTPIATNVPRDAKWATFTMPGYQETKVPIAREMNPWVLGNLFIGGLVGMLIDSSDGNAQQASGEQSVQMHRQGMATGQLPPRFTLAN